MSRHEITLTVNSAAHRAQVAARLSLVDFLRDVLRLTGTHTGCEHGVCGACSILLDGKPVRSCLHLRGAGRWRTDRHRRRPGAGSRRHSACCRIRFWETHALQCGFCTPGMLIAAHALLEQTVTPSEEDIRDAIGGNLCRCTGYKQIVDAITLAAERLRGANRRSANDAMTPEPTEPSAISRSKRRPKEDRRFVAGIGPLSSPISRLPGMLHVALVASPYPRARIVGIDAATALALPGVHGGRHRRGTGAGDRAAATAGSICPRCGAIRSRVDIARYVGEWVAAVVAETPRARRGRGRARRGRVRAAAARRRSRGGAAARARRRCIPSTARNVLFRAQFVWGPVDEDFAAADHRLSFRARWHRSSTVPIETFGVARAVGSGAAAARCLGLDPDAEISRPARPRAAPAGQRRARPFRCRCRRQLWREARH